MPNPIVSTTGEDHRRRWRGNEEMASPGATRSSTHSLLPHVRRREFTPAAGYVATRGGSEGGWGRGGWSEGWVGGSWWWWGSGRRSG